MKTIVLNLPNQLTLFSAMKPFLYPLEANGDLLLLDYSDQTETYDSTDFTSSVASKVSQELKRSGFPKWQIVFIFQIGNYEKYIGCVNKQLFDIKNIILKKVLTKSITKPDYMFAILLDELERDTTGEPINQRQKMTWENDVKGYISANDKFEDFFIKQSDINTIAKYWDDFGEDIRSGLQNFNTNAGIEQFYNIKSKDICNKIYNCLSKAEEAFDQLILESEKKHSKYYKPKKQSLKIIICEDGKSIEFDDKKKILEDMKSFFSENYKEIINKNIIKLMGKDPVRGLLKKYLREKISLKSDKYKAFTCLRLKMKSVSGQRSDYNDMLNLTYLLIFLVDQGKSVYLNPDSLKSPQLIDNNIFYVENIEIDKTKLMSKIFEYYRFLVVAKKIIKEKISMPLKSDVVLFENFCFCPEINTLRIQSDRIKKFEKLNIPEFNIWYKETEKYIIKGLIVTANLNLKKCYNAINEWENTEIIQKNVDVHNKISDLKKNKNELNEKLEKLSLYAIPKEFSNQFKLLKDIISILIKGKTTIIDIIFYCFIAAFIFTLSSIINIIKDLNISNFIYFFIGYCFCILIWLFKKQKINILNNKREAYNEAKELENNIETNYNQNMDYLKKMCELTRTVKNMNNINNVIESDSTIRKQMEFHDRELTNHIIFIKTILKFDFKIDQNIDHNQYFINLNYSKPVYRNPIYSPGLIMNENIEYTLKTGTATKRETRLSSRYMPALKNITITQDLIYS